MKISSNSWHWKLNQFAHTKMTEDRKYSLCKYFWLTVASVLLSMLMVFTALFAISFIVMPTLALFDVIENNPATSVQAAIFCAFVIGCGFMLLKEYYKETIKPKIYGSTRQPKRVNIAFEYVKAKKSKICPILEVE